MVAASSGYNGSIKYLCTKSTACIKSLFIIMENILKANGVECLGFRCLPQMFVGFKGFYSTRLKDYFLSRIYSVKSIWRSSIIVLSSLCSSHSWLPCFHHPGYHLPKASCVLENFCMRR